MSDTVRVVGPGRAGGAFARALASVGWTIEVLGRTDDPAPAARGAALVLICVPDGSVAEVAAAVDPDPDCVVAHCAGALTLDVLGGHSRVASLHPLVALPSPQLGAERLRGTWFAVAGDPLVRRVVEQLEGRAVEVDDRDRVAYHAAAVMASNHLVALLGQVERVAGAVGVPLEAYLDLVRGTVENVASLGPEAALTGPVARGDWATVRRHLAAIDEGERDAYRALAERAARLVGAIPDLPGDR